MGPAATPIKGNAVVGIKEAEVVIDHKNKIDASPAWHKWIEKHGVLTSRFVA